MVPVPLRISAAIDTQLGTDVAWMPVDVGCSDTDVFRLEPSGQDDRGPMLYLKSAAGGYAAAELREEHDRLRWMQGHAALAGLTPQVIASADDGDAFLMLTSAVPGVMSMDPSLDFAGIPGLQAETVRQLAAGMKLLHGLDVSGCPFDRSLAMCLPQAKNRMEQGLIDTDDFDAVRQGVQTADHYAQLIAERPGDEDMVFTHGDYCLPNVLVQPETGRLTGFIDLARAGIADRHQDIALCSRSLARNFGAEWVPLLYDAYGRHWIDPAKIEYYRLLDEFF